MVFHFENFQANNGRGLNSSLIMLPTIPKPWTPHWIISQVIRLFWGLGIKFWLKLDPMCE